MDSIRPLPGFHDRRSPSASPLGHDRRSPSSASPYYFSETDFRRNDTHHKSFRDRTISYGIAQEEQLNFILLGNPTFVNRVRYECGRIINNQTTECFIVIVIVFNSIMLGIGTFNFVANNPPLQRAFWIIDFICLCLFTIEIGMQVIFRQWQMLNDYLLVFDFIVIAMSWMIESLDIGRALRIIRASRLVVRTHGLRNLVEALIKCLPNIFAVGLLLMLVLYVYGVIFTSLFKDLYADGYLDQDYFSRLDKTLFTLFQMMTMDTWSSITKQVMVVYPLAWFPFILFIITTTFLILNLAVGVICNAVSNANQHEIETRVVQVVSSEVGERNDTRLQSLEDKICKLTMMIENMTTGGEQSRRQSNSNTTNTSTVSRHSPRGIRTPQRIITEPS